MSRIEVNIDRVVLRGFDPADRHSLVNGLKSELSRVLANPDTGIKSARSHRTPVLRLGRLPLETESSGGRKFAKGMANAIGKGLQP